MLYRKTKIKKIILICTIVLTCNVVHAQQRMVKEIAFHLYTDSLKKGTYNYINVDALLDNGHWFPMDTSRISFASSVGTWYGNNLVVGKDMATDSVKIRAFVKTNPIMMIETTLYFKKNADPQTLPTMQDIMDGNPNRGRRKER
ncbi:MULTISPECIES: hypothetical protein [Chitinophagaceae]